MKGLITLLENIYSQIIDFDPQKINQLTPTQFQLKILCVITLPIIEK